MDDVLPIAASVLGVFLVMIAGAVCRRARWLTAESDRSLANLTANLLLPALFFDRVVGSEQLQSLASTWFPPLIGFAFTALGFAIAALVAYAIGPLIGLKTPAHRRAFVLCVGICNYGYIPLPLAQQFYPQAEVTLIIHNVGVDMALWSIGIVVIAGRVGANWRRIFMSPPLIAVVVGLAIKQSGAAPWLPKPLLQMAEMLGQCSIPMGLLLSGAIIVDYLPRMKWNEGKSILAAAALVRLLLIPLLMLAFAHWMLSEPALQQVMLLQAAMPAATFPIVLVRLYGQDVGTAVQVVLGTSLLALVTIPLWMLLGAMWLGPSVTPAG